MSQSDRFNLKVSWAIVACAMTLSTQADDKPAIDDDLDDKVLVVRGSEPEKMVDRTIEEVDEQDISEVMPTSVAEQLRYLSNIESEGGPRNGSQTIIIRRLG
ncbi:MAG: hypothetical protein V2I33_00900, partial [Kangiellaceae bacterium]|nr:hypothetical protein [Kangiellaceae bacterium]